MPVAFRDFLVNNLSGTSRLSPLAVEAAPAGPVVCSQVNPSFAPTELPLLAVVRGDATQTSPAGARLRTPVESDVHLL